MRAQVLVVDDEAVIRGVLASWLDEAGYDCACAEGAADALAQVADSPFDVVFLGARLSDGPALAQRLLKSDPETGIVMVTDGQSSHDTMTMLGVNPLPKPFTREQLLAAVSQASTRHFDSKPSSLLPTHEQAVLNRTEELRQLVSRADTSSADAVDAVLVVLERRNPDAVSHARRVAKIAASLAVDMGLSETERVVVERGALLHDVGKLVMPASLMCKGSALTRAELDLIRMHPLAGYTILTGAPSLRLAAEIVLSSHEAWDGSGYPRRLAGESIPLGARITAVADTYDVLTWSPTGQAAVHVQAAAELVRASGTQFDPAIVRAWLRTLEDSRVVRGTVHDESVERRDSSSNHGRL